MGGHSKAPFDKLNLAYHVGDNEKDVAKNRSVLDAYLPAEATWLDQVHGNKVHVLNQDTDISQLVSADAMYTNLRRRPLAIMTADCLPILLASKHGDEVAAIHGGWRPLAAGIIANTLKHFCAPPTEVVAWFGPAIGVSAFEVGAEVRQEFIEQGTEFSRAFSPTTSNKYMADIFLIAKRQLHAHGVTSIYGGNACTVSQPELFFSYRRDGQCGRMATVIWRK
ncbi:peptidoglycan editing factor PgeF [Pseudoalteromonas luteoviolacea]|uniref:peptidoglycan editing factor PgeF n=1 Tax=Pseudoalteromonas luteoviolacea TaxID=43657 RepID=UPI000A8CED35